MQGKKSDSFDSLSVGLLGNAATQRYTDRTRGIFEDAEHLISLSNKWKNVASDKAQGHLFEQLEVSKFNLDALKKDSNLFAKTTASMGKPTDPIDIVIKKGQKTVREIQAKSCNTAARSTFSLSQKKYEEMARLAPSDQAERIEALLKKRIEAGTLKKEDYEQTLRNFQKSLSHDGVESKGTVYQDALDATNAKKVKEMSDSIKLDATLTDMHESGKKSGNIGASISAGVAVVSGVHQIYNDEADIGKVVANISVEAAKGYATGYACTAISKGITHSTTHVLGHATSKVLTRSNAPVAIAAGVVTTGKSMLSYMQGDIDSEQLLSEISHTAITCTSSFYYGAIGQVVIPIPVVGALIGSGVGYFIGNMLHQSSLIALGDSQVVKVAKERRKAIEAMCLTMIPIIQKNREELEQSLNKHFSDRKEIFSEAFNILDASLGEWNHDTFVSGLENINNQFGATLQFKNFDEFDTFMNGDEVFQF